jgi:hypothetical protein
VIARLWKRLALTSVEGLSLLSIVFASVILVAGNFLSARHFKRWDLTESRRYTLSAATLETLRGLDEPVHVWLLMHSSDPIRVSLRQTLVSYEAVSPKIEVHAIDPDRDPIAFADVKQRFKMDAGRASGGTVIADAPAVVSQGDRHWFVSHADLLDIEKSDDPRAKPKEERAITGAIRSVRKGTKSRLCFVQGHGERELTDGSADGIQFLQTLLEKDNYDVASVEATGTEPFKGCSVVVVAGARAPYSKDEEQKLKAYVLGGGNALIAVSPINADTDTGMALPGLSEVTKPFGIEFDQDLVFELDDKRVFPDSRGIRFLGEAKDHAISQALLPGPNRINLQTIVHFARSLRAVPGEGGVIPTPLLVTSSVAYGVTNIAGAAKWDGLPAKKTTDLSGPLTLAFAAERIASPGQKAPRMVVIGTGSAFLGVHWRVDGTGRGMAMLVENAIAWLASTPQVLDVPDRQDVAAGIRITAESKDEIQRFVLVYIPLAALLLGLLVFFFRRSNERAPHKPAK